jgi:hypothetical protein
MVPYDFYQILPPQASVLNKTIEFLTYNLFIA